MRIRDNFRAIISVLDIPSVFAVSLLLYCFLAYLIIDELGVMSPARRRIVEIKRFLDSQSSAEEKNGVYILGSSVTNEGLDCNIVDKLLPDGLESYNLAWTGGYFKQWVLMLPAVKAAPSSLTVLCVDICSLSKPSPFPLELLNIANWWGFFPKEDLESFADFLSEEELSNVRESKLTCLWNMRFFLTEAVDAYIRETSRSDLRYDGYCSNFKSPWVMRKGIPDAAMAKHIESSRQLLAGLSVNDVKEAARFLEAIIKYLRRDGTRVLVVLTPINPRVAEVLDKDIEFFILSTLSELVKKHSARLVNCSKLLAAAQFTDAIHPLHQGRANWSKVLGEAICREFSLRE